MRVLADAGAAEFVGLAEREQRAHSYDAFDFVHVAVVDYQPTVVDIAEFGELGVFQIGDVDAGEFFFGDEDVFGAHTVQIEDADDDVAMPRREHGAGVRYHRAQIFEVVIAGGAVFGELVFA